MISKEHRAALQVSAKNPAHILQVFKERGRYLFGKDRVDDMFSELKRHIVDPMRCVFVPDERSTAQSNYLAMFLSDYGKFIVLPCFVTDNLLDILTLKDGFKDDNPNWHISKYNEIGGKRGIAPINLVARNNNS
jgi:hypothetical protein